MMVQQMFRVLLAGLILHGSIVFAQQSVEKNDPQPDKQTKQLELLRQLAINQISRGDVEKSVATLDRMRQVLEKMPVPPFQNTWECGCWAIIQEPQVNGPDSISRHYDWMIQQLNRIPDGKVEAPDFMSFLKCLAMVLDRVYMLPNGAAMSEDFLLNLYAWSQKHPANQLDTMLKTQLLGYLLNCYLEQKDTDQAEKYYQMMVHMTMQEDAPDNPGMQEMMREIAEENPVFMMLRAAILQIQGKTAESSELLLQAVRKELEDSDGAQLADFYAFLLDWKRNGVDLSDYQDVMNELENHLKDCLQTGIHVIRVNPGSLAEKIGLKVDDHILRYGGDPVVDANRFSCCSWNAAVQKQKKQVEIVVLRDGKELSFSVEGGFLGVGIE